MKKRALFFPLAIAVILFSTQKTWAGPRSVFSAKRLINRELSQLRGARVQDLPTPRERFDSVAIVDWFNPPSEHGGLISEIVISPPKNIESSFPPELLSRVHPPLRPHLVSFVQDPKAFTDFELLELLRAFYETLVRAEAKAGNIKGKLDPIKRCFTSDGTFVDSLQVFRAASVGTHTTVYGLIFHAAVMLNALERAAEFSPEIYNLSWGPGGVIKSLLVEEFIEAHPDAVFVTAAGNNGIKLDTVAIRKFGFFPDTICARSNVVCVTATHRWTHLLEELGTPVLAKTANYGGAVKLAAPGAFRSSTEPTSRLIGTSFAAPGVTQTLALMRRANPSAPIIDLLEILKQSVQKTGNSVIDENTIWGGALNKKEAIYRAFRQSEDQTDRPDSILHGKD